MTTEFVPRIAIFGDKGSGKSCIVQNLITRGLFLPDYKWHEVDTFQHELQFDTYSVRVEIVDTWAETDYDAIEFWDTWMEGCHGFVWVYSISDRKGAGPEDNFTRLNKLWERKRARDGKGRDRVPLVLLGNKVDLAIENPVKYRYVERKLGERKAKEYKAVGLFETSAKSGEGVRDAFHCVVAQAFKNAGKKMKKSSGSRRAQKWRSDGPGDGSPPTVTFTKGGVPVHRITCSRDVKRLQLDGGSTVNSTSTILIKDCIMQWSSHLDGAPWLRELLVTRANMRSLPTGLGGLGGLRVLCVSKNKLTTLPDSISLCVHLERLDASSNELNRVPASIGGLGDLKVLRIDENPLLYSLEDSLVRSSVIHSRKCR